MPMIALMQLDGLNGLTDTYMLQCMMMMMTDGSINVIRYM